MFIAKCPSERDVFNQWNNNKSFFATRQPIQRNGYFKRLCKRSYMVVRNPADATVYKTEAEAKADIPIVFDLIKADSIPKKVIQKSGFFS